MMDSGFTKSVNSPSNLQGVYIGTVKKVDFGLRKVWVQVGRLAGKKTFGPLLIVGEMPDTEDKVACMFTESGDLMVIGIIQQSRTGSSSEGGFLLTATGHYLLRGSGSGRILRG